MKIIKDKLWRFLYKICFNASNDAIKMANSDVEGIIWRRAAEETATFIAESGIPLHVSFPDRFSMMEMCLRKISGQGLIIELGVYKGESLIHISKNIGERMVYGFDSFEGL